MLFSLTVRYNLESVTTCLPLLESLYVYFNKDFFSLFGCILLYDTTFLPILDINEIFVKIKVENQMHCYYIFARYYSDQMLVELGFYGDIVILVFLIDYLRIKYIVVRYLTYYSQLLHV